MSLDTDNAIRKFRDHCKELLKYTVIAYPLNETEPMIGQFTNVSITMMEYACLKNAIESWGRYDCQPKFRDLRND